MQNYSVVKKLLYKIMNFNDSGSSSYKFVSGILSNLYDLIYDIIEERTIWLVFNYFFICTIVL